MKKQALLSVFFILSVGIPFSQTAKSPLSQISIEYLPDLDKAGVNALIEK